MLQKLENAYLAILRFIVIAAAGLLLIGAVVFGAMSFQSTQSAKDEQSATPHISEQDLIAALQKQPEAPVAKPADYVDDQDKTDKNTSNYDNVLKAVVAFCRKHDPAYDERIDDYVKTIESMNVIMQKKGNSLDDNMQTAYSSNIHASITKALASKEAETAVKTKEPLQVAAEIFDAFNEKFGNEINKINASAAERQQEAAEKQADATQSMYIAAGAFGAFLLVVFLSIFIKIERNLRGIKGVD